MYDIHSHILYGVDDGAETLEESLQMAEQAAAAGIRAVIATPHYIEGMYTSDSRDNIIRLEKLNEEIRKAGIALDIYPGNELHITPDLLKLIKSGKAAALNNSRYVLVELPFFEVPAYTEKLLFQLALNGYVAVIAHPERNESVMEDLGILYNLIRKGALVQVSAPSIAGCYGRRVRKTALLMLKHFMVHLFGSDMHSRDSRQSSVKEAARLLREKYPEQAACILSDNPGKVIANKAVKPVEPIKIH